MADAGAAPPLPTQKTRGWEFTDLSGLDLEAYTEAPDGDDEARSRADGVLNPPEGSDHLVVQVDGSVLEGGSVDVEGDGRPHEPLVASLEASLERFPHLREMLGALAPARRSIRRPQRRCLARRGARLRAPRQAARGSGADRGGAGRRRRGALLPHADRPRGGRRGGGLGAMALHGFESGLALQHGHRGLGRPRREPPLRHRPGTQRARLGLRHPARRGRARRAPRLGRARVRFRARQGPDGDPPRRIGFQRTGDRRLRRQRLPASRLRHHPGARAPRTRPPISPSAASSRNPRPRSGAG